VDCGNASDPLAETNSSSGRKCRRRHLLAHPHSLARDADKTDEARGRGANYPKQKRGQPRQRIIAARENPHIGPGIEIMLNRQQENVFVSAPLAKLGAIGVLFPAHAAQQLSIGGTERDQIATTAMVRPEDQFSRRQLSKRALDIDRAKPGAIPADRDYFVIAQLRDFFDRVLQARGETPADLTMNMWTGNRRFPSRCEKMNIDRGQNFVADGGDIKEPTRRFRKRTPREVDVDFVGEYEHGLSGHTFGYETGGNATSLFQAGPRFRALRFC
jgi:hypothetical protein